MQAVLSRLPDGDWLYRNRGAILGFLAGVLVPLAVTAFFTVIYTGYGLWETPPRPPVVYPNW